MANNTKTVKEHMLEYLDDPRRGAGEIYYTQQEVSSHYSTVISISVIHLAVIYKMSATSSGGLDNMCMGCL